MFTINNAISPEEGFIIERAISYLVRNYNESGYNSKPVILHSIRVANLLMEMNYSKKVIVGALLHDIIEDTKITFEQLNKDFGEEICALVSAVSYNKSISDPIAQYKDMYDRIISFGKEAVILKAVDIAVNSLYIHLVSDADKRKQLIEKGTYFLNLTEKFSDELAWKLLKKRNLEEIKKLS